MRTIQVTKEQLTVYEIWQKNKDIWDSFTNRLFECYEAADSGKKEILVGAFPDFFTEKMPFLVSH